MEELTLQRLSLVGRITIPVKYFFPKTLLLPGTGIAKMSPERVYVGPSWGYVGPIWGHVRPWGAQPDFVSRILRLPETGIAKMPMLAHVGSMLGPCSPILGLRTTFHPVPVSNVALEYRKVRFRSRFGSLTGPLDWPTCLTGSQSGYLRGRDTAWPDRLKLVPDVKTLRLNTQNAPEAATSGAAEQHGLAGSPAPFSNHLSPPAGVKRHA